MSDILEQITKPFSDGISRLFRPLWDQFARDKMRFEKKRAAFYVDLAATMESQPRVNISVHIERIADRYPDEPKGRLAARWLDNYMIDGSFSEAIRDSVPEEDYAPLMIAERAGDLTKGLKELGEVVTALDATKEAVASIWLSTLFVFVAAQIFIGMYSFRIVPDIESSLPPNVPVSDLGLIAVIMHWMSVSIRTVWPLWIVFIVVSISIVKWAVPNYVGRWRQWLDRHVLPFRLYAEFQAASFIVALAAVTQRVNNKVVSVPKALQMMEPNASVWLRHHILRIVHNLEENPHGKGENFQTGMVDRETEYRMMDIADYADVSEMLKQVGGTILDTAPKELEKRAKRIQNTSRAVLVILVVAIQGGFNYMGWQFQDAVSTSGYSNAPTQISR
ncbi:type II secretion system protein [Burkholderia lata]|uniref:Type II secretion system protein n=1 Tax=Burkholderia lata (strain ATCC 17760 / DSM 23089 / LMG 22485 / NCIMB 9086 / R18194 / 383) TaxID=482957 RepID=A0A6P2RU98_BURL3|nr:type II secretory pathway component PulF-like protein [Burkholderia lata]VWC39888.1 type II secretion system protein [Burkholderia lata]